MQEQGPGPLHIFLIMANVCVSFIDILTCCQKSERDGKPFCCRDALTKRGIFSCDQGRNLAKNEIKLVRF